MTVKRGEIYWIAFDPVQSSDQGGLHPALVVQNDTGNRHSSTTVVAAITRTLPPQPYPFVVLLEPQECGLTERCAVNCAQLVTLQQAGPGARLCAPRGETVLRPIGQLGADKMAEVDDALRYSLALK